MVAENRQEPPDIVRIIENEFSRGDKLEQGAALNIITKIESWFNLVAMGRWNPKEKPPEKYILHYEYHVRKTYAPETANVIMEKSDPNTIRLFDEIVSEIQTSVDKIIESGPEAVQPYLDRMRALVE